MGLDLRSILAGLIFCAGTSAAWAQAPSRDEPVLLNADTMLYEQDQGLVTAEGNVQISQGQRILQADRVIYYQRDGRIIASGNVSLLEPSGDVLFADYVELTDEMRNGLINGFRALLTDNSRLVAASAERRDGNTTIVERGVYSPCELCAEDPTRAPLWQIKSSQVVHNQQAKRIEYRNASLEFFGVPVAWAPYFSHADPSVKRESGFLAPNAFTNSFFGAAATLPYFWVIDDYTDATITPMVSTQQGLQLAGEFRQRTTAGAYRVEGSLTRVEDEGIKGGRRTDDEVWRGHFRADGRFRLDDQFAYGFNVFRASDDTYLRRYRIPGRSANTLVSRAFVEGVNRSHFFGANGYAFQQLRPDDPAGSTPFVLPLIDYSMRTDASSIGSYFTFAGNLAALYREEGTDTRRISLDGAWVLPYTSRIGEVYELTVGMRGDGYWYNQSPTGELTQNALDSETSGRARPYAMLTWRYPLVGGYGPVQEIIEPIIQGILTPYGGNPRGQPNEDSITLEFDDTNLFSLNRYPGIDRYDGGPRLNYGMRYGLYGQGGGFTEAFVGQSLRSRDDESYPLSSGVRDKRSDIVGRLTVAPSHYLDFTGRLRIDEGSWDIAKTEIQTSFGPSFLRGAVTYARIDGSTFERGARDREAIQLSGNAKITEFWSIQASHTHDLGANSGSLANSVGIRYADECFDILLFADRTFFNVGDVERETTVGIRIRLTQLGL